MVVSLDFQRMSNAEFADEYIFSAALQQLIFENCTRNKRNPVQGLNNDILNKLSRIANENSAFRFRKLFAVLSELCETAEKPIV